MQIGSFLRLQRIWREDETNFCNSGFGVYFADFASFSLYRVYGRKQGVAACSSLPSDDCTNRILCIAMGNQVDTEGFIGDGGIKSHPYFVKAGMVLKYYFQ